MVLRWLRVVCQGLEGGIVWSHIHVIPRDVDLLQAGLKLEQDVATFGQQDITRPCKHDKIWQVRPCRAVRVSPHINFKSIHQTTKYEAVAWRRLEVPNTELKLCLLFTHAQIRVY